MAAGVIAALQNNAECNCFPAKQFDIEIGEMKRRAAARFSSRE